MTTESAKSEGEYQASLAGPPPRTDPVWTKRDGTTVRIADMDDSHLVNTLRMLRRKFVTPREFLAACRYAQTAPDGAQMAVEQEIANMQVMPQETWNALVSEAAHRGLTWEAPR